jgi:putative inorganic carbon (hco3(-)) transporter
MKKKETKAPPAKKAALSVPGTDIPLALVTLAYIFIPNFTPNLMAFDTNAPKFLALSLVNLVGFAVLLSRYKFHENPGRMGVFFKTYVGLVYSGFLVFSLLSFFNAINLTESLLQFVKIFTVFSTVFILFMILKENMNFLKWIIVIYTVLLIFDAFTDFYYISEFVRGKIDSIKEIKSVYSNKNMFASAIFVKLPSAIWLLVYRKKWLKYLGWFGVMTGITATFFTATRTFYLGLMVFTVLFMAYLLLKFYRDRQKPHLWLAGSYLLALFTAYLIFTGTQEYLYPKRDAEGPVRYVQGVGEQIASIKGVDNSAQSRLNEWKYAGKLLISNPLLGVGTGNFKLVVLKYENRNKPDFSYMYKAHNDFIEIFAETGFIGGLLYLGIFLLIGWTFLKMLFTRNKKEEDDLYSYFFLATVGIAFYSIDAFFNFPADRPEILVYFSFYLATGIAVIHQMDRKPEADKTKQPQLRLTGWKAWLPAGLILLLFGTCSWIFYLNYESSKTQRIVYQEIQSNKLTSTSAQIIAGFPAIPSLTIMGESINVQKARYLLSEKKYEQGIALLRGDRTSPYDGRREYFLAMGFDNLRNQDSALYYSEQLYKMKPLHPKNLLLICQMLEKKGDNAQVQDFLDKFLVVTKDNGQVWAFSSGFYDRQGNIDKGLEVITEAKKYLPHDTLVLKQYKYMNFKKNIEPYRSYYNQARDYYTAKDYSKAMASVNEYIALAPDDFFGHQLRAFIFYYLQEYQACIDEINKAVKLSGDAGALISLRGVCHRNLNDMAAACKDFEKAMKMGNADGKTNYEKFCRGKAGN